MSSHSSAVVGKLPILLPNLHTSGAAFAAAMRHAAAYIHAFAGETMVLVIPGEAVKYGVLPQLAQDIALLKALGIRCVLVHGADPQVEEQLTLRGVSSRYHNGVRITDAVALECVKEAVGEISFDFHAAFSQGLAQTSMAHAAMRVLSGNVITARPIGIVDGVDHLYSGVVRKVDTAMIRAVLAADAFMLLSPLGFSPTGEVFHLALEEVAEAVASALQAHKLIFFTTQQTLSDAAAKPLASEWVAEDLRQIAHNHPLHRYASVSLAALERGVQRVHFVAFEEDSGLLQELFTHEGIGVMVTANSLLQVRQATIEDITNLLTLIEPLEADGTLAKRGRSLLEREIHHFTVLEHDKVMLGCAALYPFISPAISPVNQANMAELAALSVSPAARNQGGAQRLLEHIEGSCRQMNIKKIFILTTRTAHWFIKRGFRLSTIEQLPVDRQKLYNWQRMSQVLMKDI